MAEDEDVIYEGHELHRYLLEQGYTDFEVAQFIEPGKDFQVKQKNTLQSQLWTSFRRLLSTLKPKWSVSNKEVLSTLQFQVEEILNSGMLMEEDISFIESFMSPLPVTTNKLIWSGAYALYGLSLIYLWKKKMIYVFFPTLYSCITVEHLLTKYYFSHQKLKMSKAITALIKNCKELYIMQKKSLQYIQENELLLRGYTLVNSTCGTTNMDSCTMLIFKKRWCMMSGLRISVAQSSFDAIKVLQKGIQSLILACPLSGSLDKEYHYAAYLSMQDLGIEDIHIQEDTELPCSKLKVFNQVYLLLQSEFLRRVALCLFTKLWTNSEQNISLVVSIVSDVTDKYNPLISDLLEVYTYHSPHFIKTKDNNNALKKKNWAYSDIYAGIHSAILHLQGIVYKAKEMENMLEEQQQKCELEEELLSEQLMEMLSVIISETHSCKMCFEIALDKLKLKKNSVTSVDKINPVKYSDIVEANVCELPETSRKPIPVGYTDLDPQVEDEVFEAIGPLDGEIYEDCSKEIYLLSEEDKIKQKEEKECSRRMLLELKRVLVHKAVERERREAIALKTKMENISENVKENLASEKDNVDLSKAYLCVNNSLETNISTSFYTESPEMGLLSSRDVIIGLKKSTGDEDTDVLHKKSDDLGGDAFEVLKPTNNWPLPRLKTGHDFMPSKNEYSEPLSRESSPEHNLKIKTVVYGLPKIWPKQIDEFTLCGTGENSDEEDSEEVEEDSEEESKPL